MHRMLVLLITFLVSATACSGKPSRADLDALIERTLKNVVFVEGGEFMMGDGGGAWEEDGQVRRVEFWTGYRDNKPAHRVVLDSYYIQKYEVTYSEYDIFATATGRPERYPEDRGTRFRLPDTPVGVPSWYEAKAYCQWLGEITGLPFDLPTEAQWEYAARSRGDPVAYATDTGWLDRGVNFGKRPDGYGVSSITPVGIHPPNPLGIYDMTRNVTEWVNDWYAKDYYQHSPVHNPRGPANGKKKVLRGGGNIGSPQYDTVYTRYKEKPGSDGAIYNGMRCVLNISEKYTFDELLKKVFENR